MDIPYKELARFRATDREQCGVIVACGNRIKRLVEVPNRAENDEDYVILMDDFMKVFLGLVADERVLGFFHTHLPHHGSDPTDADFDGAKRFPEYSNFVYYPPSQQIIWYSGLAEEMMA